MNNVAKATRLYIMFHIAINKQGEKVWRLGGGKKGEYRKNEFAMNYSNNGLCKASRVLLWRQSASSTSSKPGTSRISNKST